MSGISKQIHKVIMIDGSMFTGSGKRGAISPAECLEEFLGSIVWPSNTGRFSSKVLSSPMYHLIIE